MFSCEYINLDAQISQGPGKLLNVYVHASGFSLSRGYQGARMEGDEGYPVSGQLRFTTIW